MKSFLKKIYYKFIFNFTGPKTRFTRIYKDNFWSSDESVSGPGSTLSQTITIRKILPEILKKYKIGTLVDVPCGDFHWMSQINLQDVTYLGGDIVDDIIKKNNQRYASNNVKFKVIDLISDPLPACDALIVRDCIIHLSNDLVIKALKNIKKSDIKYLIINNFPDISENINIKTGTWRRVNLSLPPFNLFEPLEVWEETEHFNDIAGRKNTVIFDVKTLVIL